MLEEFIKDMHPYGLERWMADHPEEIIASIRWWLNRLKNDVKNDRKSSYDGDMRNIVERLALLEARLKKEIE